MNKKEVLRYIEEYVLSENNKRKTIEYEILSGQNQLTIAKYFESYDCRLDDDVYQRDSCTIVGKLKNTNVILASGTLFVTDYECYKSVFFWKKTDDNCKLKKVYLERYRQLIGDVCVTLGFTQFTGSIRVSGDMLTKMKMVNMFYNLINNIIHDWNVFVHVEPCGVCFVGYELLTESVLEIDEDVICNLGAVSPDSIVSYKIAKKFGMTKMENLFHDTTLGSVFFSKAES